AGRVRGQQENAAHLPAPGQRVESVSSPHASSARSSADVDPRAPQDRPCDRGARPRNCRPPALPSRAGEPRAHAYDVRARSKRGGAAGEGASRQNEIRNDSPLPRECRQSAIRGWYVDGLYIRLTKGGFMFALFAKCTRVSGWLGAALLALSIGGM